MHGRPTSRLGHGLAARSSRGGGPRAPADKVSRKRRCEHREGGGNAPDEVATARAHPRNGLTCGGGAEVARRCPTVMEVLQSRVAPVVGSCSTRGERRG
jgi:hypothetical protein